LLSLTLSFPLLHRKQESERWLDFYSLWFLWAAFEINANFN